MSDTDDSVDAEPPRRRIWQVPVLSDDFEHVDDPFSLLALGTEKPRSGTEWWADPKLLARCAGQGSFYFFRDGAPAAVFARFLGQPIDRHLASEMMQLADCLQINVDPGPGGWDGRPQGVIWLKRPRWR